MSRGPCSGDLIRARSGTLLRGPESCPVDSGDRPKWPAAGPPRRGVVVVDVRATLCAGVGARSTSWAAVRANA